MRLHTFITLNLDAILVDWVAFARELQADTGHLDEAGLLDHGRLVLSEIALDMQKPQSDVERKNKSHGHHASASARPKAPSTIHALQRRSQGFNIEELVAEYRALRASVLRLWSQQSDRAPAMNLDDVTRFNEAVDQAVAESLQAFMEEIERSRDLFLGVLGHDLRGPLSTIGNIATIERLGIPNRSHNAEVILRSVAQMKALLDDLVEYVRHRRSTGFEIHRENIHLGEFAANTLDEIASIQDHRSIQLQVEGDLLGEWDARRLHQALSNLLFNALKYGDPDAPICVALDGRSDHEVVLSVQNTGEPIPPESMPRLFDPFVRGERPENSEQVGRSGANMGLGLHIVQEIAKAHGGTVGVVSDKRWTRFTLRLPRRPQAMRA